MCIFISVFPKKNEPVVYIIALGGLQSSFEMASIFI